MRLSEKLVSAWRESTLRERTRGFLLGRQNDRPSLPFHLEDVEIPAGDPYASWRRLVFKNGLPTGRWIYLRYEVSLFAPLKRPVVQFQTRRGVAEKMLPAALFGQQAWIGYLPADTTGILVGDDTADPACRLRLTSMTIISWPILMALALSCNDIMRMLYSIGLWLSRLLDRARDELEACLAPTPLKFYDRWRRQLSPAAPCAVDVSRIHRLEGGPRVAFLLDARGGIPAGAYATTLASLRQQWKSDWSLVLITVDGVLPDAVRDSLEDTDRLSLVRGTDLIRHLRSALSPEAVCTVLECGDTVPPYTTAIVSDHFRAHADCLLAYGDEDAVDSAGRYCEPKLKPDWSPLFEGASSYAGDAVYARLSRLDHLDQKSISALVPAIDVREFARTAEAPRIDHLRRVLLTKRAAPRRRPHACPRPRRQVEGSVTVIIPNKDQAEMLSDCVSSIQRLSSTPFELIIVDNGSTDPAIGRLYEKLGSKLALKVISAPGPFNFARLCNQAAAQATGEILVFLNNDTAALNHEWHASLVYWARRPDVGIVGAKLLYPSGAVQHGGIVLGMGGYAGHFEWEMPSEHSGYLDRLNVDHELSAVTGACIAVEKRKFESVGGFDAESFPVDLNDVDLCLRLSEKGWATLFSADSVLLHRHSATRGRLLYGPERYAFEKGNFHSRWKARIRDDAYFHPALSLQSTLTMLG